MGVILISFMFVPHLVLWSPIVPVTWVSYSPYLWFSLPVSVLMLLEISQKEQQTLDEVTDNVEMPRSRPHWHCPT